MTSQLIQQDRLRGFTESNTYDHRPTSETINMRTPSVRQNSTHLSNPTYQTPELARQRQMQKPNKVTATHSKVTASASSSNQDQHRNNVANKTPENSKLYRFVLPPEYDADDTRWTLKYRKNLPGLVELMPQSGVYVSSGYLNYCQQVSKDCKSLAPRLLTEMH
ncbi:unnamed protein product [Pieris macdunnoughi]|uniref:Uncharacterized protein n=1 Tax=Pieris macdunnoughi TaxID=345717 RepID=A0A821X2A1_9NEOP|nr:unnamed protein product [Pieris macdunnoughi]